MADSTTTSTSNLISGQNSQYDLLSGSINFTGLGSGSDMSKVVDQLVAIESIHKQRLELWKQTWQAKIESMRSLNQRLEAIEEAAGAMDTKDEFMVRQASSSDSSVVTATASSEAKNGAYQVEVATDSVHILSAAGVDSTATTITAGTTSDLVLAINGTTYTISLGASASLSSVVNTINSYFTTDSTLEASIYDDGTDSRNYRLTLTTKQGGDDNRIIVKKSPLLVSLNYQDVVLYTDFSGASTTSDITVGGQFSGDASETVGGQGYYVYTVSLATTSDVTVGTTAFNLDWSVTTATTTYTGTATVGADYQPGDNIAIHDWGLNIQLSEGVISGSDSFTVTAYANDIDDPELGTWSGVTVTSDGNYLGTVNKTYSFTVVTGSSINDAGTAGTAVLRWTDSTGGTGTVSVTQSNTVYAVEEGVKINFTAEGALVEGDTFQINVFAPDRQQSQDKGLAQVTKLVHAGFQDQDQTAVTTKDADFTYVYAGTTVTVDITAGYTLTQLRDAINNDSDNPGVTASIINDGLGLPTSYKLVLTGDDTGAANQITYVTHDFSGSSFSTAGDVGGGFSRTQWATNSLSKVDGFPTAANEYLQSSTNRVEGVIPGVSLDLHDAGSAVITVSTDIDAVMGNIEALINAVNYAQSFIREETKYDATTKEAGILIGNYSYYILKSRIDSALNSNVSGLTDGTDTYINIAQIGIHTDPDAEGRWVIDTTTLRNALNTDIDAVANLFIENETKDSTGVAKRTYDEMVKLTDPEDGTLNVLIRNYTDIIENIDKKIESEEKRLALYRQRLQERFARLEESLAILNAQSQSLEAAIAQLPKAGQK